MNKENLTRGLAVVAVILSGSAFYFSWHTNQYCVHEIPSTYMIPGSSGFAVPTTTLLSQ